MSSYHRVLTLIIISGFLAGCSRATPTGQATLAQATLPQATQPQATPTQGVQLTAGPSEDTLKETASSFFDQLAQLDFTGAIARFNVTQARTMPIDILRATWHDLVSKMGPYQKQIASQSEELSGTKVLVVTLQFEDGLINAHVGFDSSGQISGLTFDRVNSPAATPTPTK
jgi:hypothetical protein